MAQRNPKRALRAVNAAPAEVGRFTVRPFTLGLAAILEEIGSPLAGDSPAPRGVGGWTETLFAFTRPASESKALLGGRDGRAAFARAAAEWADGVSVAEAAALIRAAADAALVAANVHPDGDGGEGGKDAGKNPARARRTATAG